MPVEIRDGQDVAFLRLWQRLRPHQRRQVVVLLEALAAGSSMADALMEFYRACGLTAEEAEAKASRPGAPAPEGAWRRLLD